MKVVCYLLCAFVGLAQARPVVIEEAATLTRPDSSWQGFGSFGVAIDGDFALVSGTRQVPDSTQPGGTRNEGAAFLYRHIGTSWNYVGQLGPVDVIRDGIAPGLAMKGGIAVTMIGSTRVFERSGDTWTWTSYIDTDVQGSDIEIDAGRIFMSRITCNFDAIVARDFGGLWSVDGELRGHAQVCDEYNAPGSVQGDLQGDRAAVFNPQNEYGDPPLVRFYRRGANGWQPSTTLDYSGLLPNVGAFGSEVALSGPYAVVNGGRKRGTHLAYLVNDSTYAWAKTGLQEVDSYMQPGEISASSLERVGPGLFAQSKYSPDRKAFVVNLFRVNDDAARTSTHIATLQTSKGDPTGTRIDSDGTRVIVNGDIQPASNTVKIFELPASYENADVQTHDFESASAGALWQPSAGSAFSVYKSGSNGVYRQASDAGDASSYLPASFRGNQSIQADITFRRLVGNHAWAGVLTRRTDDSNYYYVSLRASGTVDLKRRVNGVYRTLASQSVVVRPGDRYRLRLESVGSVHRVFLDERLLLTARDASLEEGAAGVVMYHASVDYDNVVVTPSPRTTIYETDFWTGPLDLWSFTGYSASGWQIADDVLHQRAVGGYMRASIGTPTEDQVVRAFIKPVRFEGPDYWAGLMARYVDDRNLLYVTLRSRGVISLWRRSNGVIEQLASKYMTVSENTWYDVRLEVINNQTRVYVNGQLMLQSSASPGAPRGKVGVITYKTWADYGDFQAYQP